MKIELTLFQLRFLLFPSLTTDLDAARSIQAREILDWTEPVAIPAWLHVALQEAEAERAAEFARNYPTDTFTPIFHIQTIGPHRFLWPMETWRASRDARIASITRHRAAIKLDSDQMAATRARTAHEAKVYDWVTKLATRIVDEFFPHMKKGFLRQSFQTRIVSCEFDLDMFRRALDDTFDDDILNVCWVNVPEKPQANTNDNQGNQEGNRTHQEAEARSGAGGENPPAECVEGGREIASLRSEGCAVASARAGGIDQEGEGDHPVLKCAGRADGEAQSV